MFRVLQRVGLALAVAGMLAISSVSGYTQAISGDLVGVVTDTSGAVVPNASVVATNQATGFKQTTKTNGAGEYRLNNLPVGAYSITATAAGMSAESLRDFQIVLNKTATANLQMRPGSVSTTVEVSGTAETVDTTTAQVQTTYDNREAVVLPSANLSPTNPANANLGVLNLSLLDAGVSSSGAVGAGSGPSIGGQRPRNNNFEIEGVDNNNKTVTGPLVYVPSDSVSNFTVLQNIFTPEFGHSSGGQFNTVVKSGTNSFHGTAYEYFQNRNLNAVDVSLKNAGIFSNPRYDNNRFGGSFGGPIFKNKLFFFANYEYNPVGLATSPATPILAPTAAGYATIGALPGISATNLGILQKYLPAAGSSNGTITVAGTAIPVGPIPVAAPNFTNNKALVTSMDYNISQSDQLRGRYIYNSSVGLDNSASLGAFFLPLPSKFHLATVSEYHTFSPTVTNEFRVGYNRFANNVLAGSFVFPGLDQFPNIELNDLNLNLGPDGNAPQFTIVNTYSAVDNLSWTRGKHTIQVGVEGRKYISPQSFTQRARGDYVYNSTDLYLRDLSPDHLGERSVGVSTYYGDQIAVYSYINDTWRVTQNLSVTLGLRHEYTTIPFGERAQKLNVAASVPGLVDFSEPRAPKKNFAPRVGIAWSPGNSGKTSVRAGFGMAYDVLYDNIGILSLPPQLSVTEDTDPAVQTPNFLAGGGLPPASGNLATFATIADQRANTSNHVPVNQKDPYTESWSLGIQHEFGQNYTAEVRYLGSRGIHLNVQTHPNKITAVTAANSLPTFLSQPSQATLDALPITLNMLKAESGTDPAWGLNGFTSTITEFAPYGASTYHGLATQLNRRFAHGLQLQAAYTFSHLIDDSTADFHSTDLTPRRLSDFRNLHIDRSSSSLNHTHRVTLEAIYDVPWFKNSNYFMKNIVGNWQFAPIYTYESPSLASVQSGVDSNLNGDSAGDRAVLNPAGIPGTGSDVTALKNTLGAVVGYLATNPTAQFIVAGKGVFADAPRNTLKTRPIDNIDFAGSKRFSITERFNLEFQAQFYNIFNHPQFIPGSINAVNSISSAGPGFLSFVHPNDPNFENASQTFASNARTLQLALRLQF